MRISDWSSDVCSSDLPGGKAAQLLPVAGKARLDQSFCRQYPRIPPERHHARPGMCRDEIAVDDLHAVTAELRADLVWRRSEERRVGKECVSTCRSRWWP